ncbi:hypothetical protein GCM10023340_09460 [Nocardioides marinquilinus]|uniref:DUF4333 domain-containing protein n=1 Tax=Nocardioides marinquilinus TaxID=1210400 RepID=A0ABP9PCP9_9ACTN
MQFATRLVVVVLSMLLASTVMASGSQAQSAYRRDAEAVAQRIGCRLTETTVVAPSFDAAECRLRGRKVVVLTFRGPREQAAWLRIVRAYDGFCVASKRGVIVEPDNGGRAVATVAARRLAGGRVVCG